MKDKVLTIEQMQELANMGIDISNASMCWVETPYDGYFVIPYNKKCRDAIAIAYGTKTPESLPTFTLEDILDILPQGFYLEQNTTSLDKKVFLQINKTAGGGYSIAYEQSWDEDGKLRIKVHGQQLNDSLLDAAFNLLKWCKQNNYI